MRSATSPSTPVFLLTGFLGSGKTTLLNAALRCPEFAHTAVIVNEFGDIGLDHHLIATATDNVVLLESGCLCCTLGDSLPETLADLYRRRSTAELPPFERVVLETTGIADPAPLINTLLGHRLVTDVYGLAAVITTVDGEHATVQLQRQWEVTKQVALADRLVITKADRISAEVLQALDRQLAEMNPLAERTISTANNPAQTLFIPPAKAYTPPRYVALASAAHELQCFSCFLEHPVSWSGLSAWCRLIQDRLGDRVLRTKGLLRISDDDSIQFLQGVQRVFHPPQRLHVWPDLDRRGRLICIAKNVSQREFDALLPALQIEPGSEPWSAL